MFTTSPVDADEVLANFLKAMAHNEVSELEKKTKRTLPRFVFSGYAVDKDGNDYIGFDFAGIKPDAPQWAHDEYRQCLERKEQRRNMALKQQIVPK